MKKTLLLLLIAFSAAAQHGKVARHIESLVIEHKVFTPVSPLSPDPSYSGTSYKKMVDNATISSLNYSVLADMLTQKKEFIELHLPYQGNEIVMQLYKVNIHTNDFQVDTNLEKHVAYTDGIYYRGIIKGNPQSLAAFSFFNGELMGIVSGGGMQNVVVGKLQGDNSHYITYSDAKMKVENAFNCTTEPSKAPQKAVTHREQLLTQNCVTMYFELDYDHFVANDSNVTTTTNWMNGVFNNVQTLFDNDEINTAIKSIYIWTTQDPYDGSNSFENLIQFYNQRPVFNGDLGQLVTIDGGNGGVAFNHDGICTTFNYSYADVFHFYNTVPTYSWTVNVITHELGHLMGSPHTHDCYWNGNNTPIDTCGPQAGYPGLTLDNDTCTAPSNIPQSGTIMSYCHLVNDVGVDLANGFGPQPAQLIRDTVDSKNCLSTDCVNTCISLVSNLQATAITATSAQLTWTDDNPTTSWEISVTPFPFDTVWTTVTSTTYTAANLQPGTYYKLQVRPLCGDTQSLVRDFIFATATQNACSGTTFYDTGGATENYTDMEDWVRVVAPEDPSDKLTVLFTSFSLENNYDYLYVYNGNSTESPLFTAGLTGNTIPGPFTSTDASGAITFRFTSDEYTNAAGWTGNFTCNLGVGNNNVIDYAYYPNPSSGEVSIRSAQTIGKLEIFGLDGRLLYSKNANSNETKADISGFATGTYVFRMEIEGKSVSFRIIRK